MGYDANDDTLTFNANGDLIDKATRKKVKSKVVTTTTTTTTTTEKGGE